jgi:hypothetical protein
MILRYQISDTGITILPILSFAMAIWNHFQLILIFLNISGEVKNRGKIYEKGNYNPGWLALGVEFGKH